MKGLYVIWNKPELLIRTFKVYFIRKYYFENILLCIVHNDPKARN